MGVILTDAPISIFNTFNTFIQYISRFNTFEDAGMGVTCNIICNNKILHFHAVDNVQYVPQIDYVICNCNILHLNVICNCLLLGILHSYNIIFHIDN